MDWDGLEFLHRPNNACISSVSLSRASSYFRQSSSIAGNFWDSPFPNPSVILFTFPLSISPLFLPSTLFHLLEQKAEFSVACYTPTAAMSMAYFRIITNLKLRNRATASATGSNAEKSTRICIIAEKLENIWELGSILCSNLTTLFQFITLIETNDYHFGTCCVWLSISMCILELFPVYCAYFDWLLLAMRL